MTRKRNLYFPSPQPLTNSASRFPNFRPLTWSCKRESPFERITQPCPTIKPKTPPHPPRPRPPSRPQKKKGGPRTAEGKRRSSLNATRHQLLSKTYIATPEESAAFDAHMAAYREALAPVGFLESELATLIAMDRWQNYARDYDRKLDFCAAGIWTTPKPSMSITRKSPKPWPRRKHGPPKPTPYRS